MPNTSAWQFCKFIESKFGFNRLTEIACATLTFMLGGPRIWELNKKTNNLIIVTAWMPAYIDNIAEILQRMKKSGFNVAIFPEWQKNNEKKYNEEMKKYSDFDIYYDSHRALPFIKSRSFISSTATKHFYFSKTEKRFFYFHSVAGLSGFPEGGMDDYTDFLCATTQQLDELNERFYKQGLKRRLHAAGYPKFDAICNRLKKISPSPSEFGTQKVVVLLAPSYASDDVYSDVSMLPYIESLIQYILELNYKVIFRPHPVSLRRGGFIEKIEASRRLYESNPNFLFDETQDYFETYCKSSIMVTDVSGTSMTFKLAFGKPVVFYTPNPTRAIEAYNAISQIGPIIDQIQSLERMLKNALNTAPETAAPKIFNPGRSADVFQNILGSQS